MAENEKKVRVYISELLFFWLRKWRTVIVVALIAGLLLGGYKYYKLFISEGTDAEDEVVTTEEADAEAESVSESIAFYEAGIEIRERRIDDLSEYVATSVIMSLNAYAADTINMTYYLSTEDSSAADLLVTAYRKFVTCGDLTDMLLECGGEITEAELQYLLSFVSSSLTVSGEEYTIYDTANGTAAGSIYVNDGQIKTISISLVAENETIGNEYIEIIEAAMEGYSATVAELYGSHELELISSTLTSEINETLQSYQSTILSTYSNEVSALQTWRDKLETLEEEAEELDEHSERGTYGSDVKNIAAYFIIGVLLGLCAALFMLACVFVMSDTLYTVKGFSYLFDYALTSYMPERPRKRIFAFIDRAIFKRECKSFGIADAEQEYELLIRKINFDIEQNAVKNVLLVGSEKNTASEYAANKLQALLRPAEDLIGHSFAAVQDAIVRAGDDTMVVVIENRGRSKKKRIYRNFELINTYSGAKNIVECVIC